MASTASSHVPCGYNGHYHLYMTITQNKRDASTNQSNVTVKMYAQSDSSSYGAYNLDASGNILEWEQPESTNPYSKGDKVTHNGKTWRSTIDGNVWEPGVYGWEEI